MLTTYIDGSLGFSGRGFLLFGKSFPMPFASRREIYFQILRVMYDLDSSTFDRFYYKSENNFLRNRRLTIRPIAKSLDKLYLSQRAHKPYEKIGEYFLASAGDPGSFSDRLKMLLDANGLDSSELIVFWD